MSTTLHDRAGMGNLPSSSIRAMTPNERAPKYKERLFQGLENFANFGNSFAEYRTFAQEWPTFCPVEVRSKKTNEPMGFLLDQTYHWVTKGMRDYLRRVWRSEDRALEQQVPCVLLGLNTVTAKKNTEDFGSPADLVFESQLVNLTTRKNVYPVSPVISVDWIRGEFSYSPLNDFQRAVYLLFRESWRARSCSQCMRLFVAGKPAQLYCSTRCSGAARRQRDRELWKTIGAAKRRARKFQSNGRKIGGRSPKKGKRNGK
jgi:hypothetical protein